MSHRTCNLEGCETRHYAKGWCRYHYRRWRCYGTPTPTPKPRKLDGVERRCSSCKVTKDQSEFSPSSYQCRECRKKYNRNNYKLGRSCKVCDSAIPDQNKLGWCHDCYQKNRRGRPRKNGRYTNVQGYVVLSGHWDHPNSWENNGCILEHVKIMSDILGRPLRKGETVHHKNGVRDDNRPENLELWASSHPWGQRIPDLLEWAHQLIEMYQDEHDKTLSK